MKRYFVLTFLLVLAIAIVGFTPSAHADKDAVEICHFGNGDVGQLIVVSNNGQSVVKHIELHGDCTDDGRFGNADNFTSPFPASFPPDGRCLCIED